MTLLLATINVLNMALQLSAVAGTAPVLPLPFSALSQGQFKFGLGSSYLNTTTNFDSTGAKIPLLSAGSLQSIQADLYGQYGISDVITLVANIPFVQNTVAGPSTTDKSTVTTSSVGAGDGTFGLRYEPFRYPVRVIGDLQIQFPLYNRLTTDQWPVLNSTSAAPLGTGVTEFTVMGRVEYPLATDFYVGGALGHT
ncbi:MAG: hypothetical protein HY074_03140, partial [Deltaproteobacteria bacterium]|nr:hypothetical protein [Deltaproteobacteria bacterium]